LFELLLKQLPFVVYFIFSPDGSDILSCPEFSSGSETSSGQERYSEQQEIVSN